MLKSPPQSLQPIPQLGNSIKIILLLSMLSGAFFAMDTLASSRHVLAQLLFFLLTVFASMLMLAMAILAHDGTHRVLYRNVFINDLVSGLLSALGGGVPFYANRQFHLLHHTYAHQGEADPEHGMHGKPFWHALLLGSFIGLYLQYKILLVNLVQMRPEHKFRWRSLKDVGFIGTAVLLYSLALSAMELSPLHTLLPAFLIFPLTFTFRAMSDHYGLPKVKRKQEQVLSGKLFPNQQVTGWVIHTPGWLEWLWSNVNYHEVHHKFPYLSHVHLKNAYKGSRHSHPYRVAKGYTRSLFAQRQRNYYEEGQSPDK